MIHLGAAYYPEHWPESRWHSDIHLMKEAGLTVVRLAEFAWSSLEPAEGEYRFGWLEKAVTLLANAGIKSVLGTPSAAPPAWLTTQYPETLATDEYGRQAQHGNRCHYCVTSPLYRDFAARIAEAMAQRFGDSSHVIGWQIDNEYNRVCYCPACRLAFQRFLLERYGTLQALNERWSTAYWSQTYSAWEQIPIPIGPHNPGLMLDFKRFITASYRSFQRRQIEAMRPHLRSEMWITHNFMGWFDGFDHYELSADLDLAAWDYYVGTGRRDWASHAAIHDLTRGFKRQAFWVMETQPGSVNWSPINNSLNKGEGRAIAWQAIGRGADGLLYWQWRSAYGGQEQLHGSLVDQSGRARPFYSEVKQIGQELAAVQELLEGSRPVQGRVALLNDYESRWSLQWQPHHKDFNYVQHLTSFHRPLAYNNVAVDVLSADAGLSGYRMVIAPALLLLDEARARSLAEYVRLGGHLILTPRSAMKNRDNALLNARQPGALVEIAGVEVEEYYALYEPVKVKGNWFAGEARIWAERLRILDTQRGQAIAHYLPSELGWLDNQVAITIHSHGMGMVYYMGTILDDAALSTFLQKTLQTANLKPLLPAPAGVEILQRSKPGAPLVYIFVNHERKAQICQLPWLASEHLRHLSQIREVILEPYGIAVVTEDQP